MTKNIPPYSTAYGNPARVPYRMEKGVTREAEYTIVTLEEALKVNTPKVRFQNNKDGVDGERNPRRTRTRAKLRKTRKPDKEKSPGLYLRLRRLAHRIELRKLLVRGMKHGERGKGREGA